MLSAKQRNNLDGSFFSPKKPRITSGKLPLDFFEHSVSLKIRKSVELKPSKANRDSDTPAFGRRRPPPVITDRKVLTALEKH